MSEVGFTKSKGASSRILSILVCRLSVDVEAACTMIVANICDCVKDIEYVSEVNTSI